MVFTFSVDGEPKNRERICAEYYLFVAHLLPATITIARATAKPSTVQKLIKKEFYISGQHVLRICFIK